jgi:ABC-2 type transport system permease protein
MAFLADTAGHKPNDPLRYFLVVVRGIFLKGVGPEILWPQMLTLAVLGVAMLRLASSRFQKTLA